MIPVDAESVSQYVEKVKVAARPRTRMPIGSAVVLPMDKMAMLRGRTRTTGVHHENGILVRTSWRMAETAKRTPQAHVAKNRHMRTNMGKNMGPPGSFPTNMRTTVATTGTTTKTPNEIALATRWDSRNRTTLIFFISPVITIALRVLAR